MVCQHRNFAAEVDVNRITDTDDEGAPVERFMADIRVRCADCGKKFRFIGLPAGMDFNSPCVSADAAEARMPIGPEGEVLAVVDGPSFSIRRTV